jgi:hypothetical protein
MRNDLSFIVLQSHQLRSTCVSSKWYLRETYRDEDDHPVACGTRLEVSRVERRAERREGSRLAARARGMRGRDRDGRDAGAGGGLPAPACNKKIEVRKYS